MMYLIFAVGIALASILFRLAPACRLTVPLLYALVAPTVFRGLYLSHTALADGIWFGLLALSALSWVVSLVRRIVDIVDEYRSEHEAVELFAGRVRQARADGEAVVSTDGL